MVGHSDGYLEPEGNGGQQGIDCMEDAGGGCRIKRGTGPVALPSEVRGHQVPEAIRPSELQLGRPQQAQIRP